LFYDLEGNVITFTASDGTMRARLDVDDEVYFSGTRVPQPRLSGRALSTYAGQFASVSDELDAAYNIFLNHNTLLLRVRDNKPKPLVPITRDVFTVDGVGTLVFDRDNRRRVRGVKLFTTAVRGIPLSKR